MSDLNYLPKQHIQYYCFLPLFMLVLSDVSITSYHHKYRYTQHNLVCLYIQTNKKTAWIFLPCFRIKTLL